MLLLSLVLLNFFLLFLSILLVNKIKLLDTAFSIKTKVLIILGFLLYPALFLIFFYSNLDLTLITEYLKHSYFYSIQLSLFYNFECYFSSLETWSSFNPNVLLTLNSFWFSLIGNLDSFSIIFLFMSHIVSFMVISFSFIYFNFSNLRVSLKLLESFKLTLNSVIFMTIMMDLLFLTDNLLLIFFLAELSLIPLSFLMVKDTTIFWRNLGSETLYENKRPFAFYYLIFFTIVSGGFGFLGITIIYFLFGSLSLASLTNFEVNNLELFVNFLSQYNISTSVYSLNEIALVFSLGCLIFWISVKVPLAPVHIWLPKAHVEGSTESSMLLAGIILKITVYVLLRLISIPAYSILLDNYRPFLISIAATTAILGAFGSLLTTDMKRITAYSSVSHMGIILSAGFYMSAVSVSVSPFITLLLAHTIISTAMFMMIGCIYKSRHGLFVSRNRLAYGGVLFVFPTYFLFGAIVFSNLNIPLTVGFVGELGTLIAVVKSGLTLGIILSIASFILLLPMLSMIGQVLLGPVRLIDFFKISSFNFKKSTVEVFYKRLIFNKLVWNTTFLNFYLLNRIYFSSIFLIILGFGIFSFLFSDFLEDSLLLFDLNLLRISSF